MDPYHVLLGICDSCMGSRHIVGQLHTAMLRFYKGRAYPNHDLKRCAELADHAEKEADVLASQQEAEAHANGSADADGEVINMEEAVPNGHGPGHDLGAHIPKGGSQLGGTAGEAAAAAAQLEVNVEELLCDLRARREYVLEYHALLTACCLRLVSLKRPLCAMLCMGRWTAAAVLALLC